MRTAIVCGAVALAGLLSACATNRETADTGYSSTVAAEAPPPPPPAYQPSYQPPPPPPAYTPPPADLRAGERG